MIGVVYLHPWLDRVIKGVCWDKKKILLLLCQVNQPCWSVKLYESMKLYEGSFLIVDA